MKPVFRKNINSLPNQLVRLNEERTPVITAQDYENRLEALYNLGGDGHTHYAIYGDREHFSNIEYFTGIDPRFEEALLILKKGKKPVFIVGDEGCDYGRRVSYPIDLVVYHAFSLPQQPRRTKTVLSQLLTEAGLDKSSKVGVIGWKWFDKKDFEGEETPFDLPVFIFNELAAVCGLEGLDNVTHLMIDNEKGLRHNLEAKELILSEIAATKSSRATLNVLQNLKEGLSELEASAHLKIGGAPLSVHPNINFAQNYFYALASPTHNQKLKRGDMVGAGMAYRRALCHRASLFIADEAELEPKRRAFAKKVYDTYFNAIKTWYEALGSGVTGGQVVEQVEQVMGPSIDFGISLNLGHTIHTDEWTNTPFYLGSTEKLHSGMGIQCDFTASFPQENVAVHAEDGLLIANKDLREEIKQLAPDSYQRMMARKEFMKNVLGIHLREEILPTSDMPGVVFPYLADLHVVLTSIE